MKNLSDFLTSVLALAVFWGIFGTIYLLASSVILLFITLFSFAWISSVAFLAISRLCKIVRGFFPRKIFAQRPAVTSLSVQLD